MPNGSKAPSLPALPTHTSVTCWVEDDNSRPVPLANVRTNISGVDVAHRNSKTDSKGKVFWMWPNQGVSSPPPSDTYSGWVWAFKGKKGSARERFTFHKAKHHDILLTLSRDSETGLAFDRWKSPTAHPLKDRTPKELLEDLQFVNGEVSRFINRTTSNLDQITAGMSALKPFRDEIFRFGEKLGVSIKVGSTVNTLGEWVNANALLRRRPNLSGGLDLFDEIFDEGWNDTTWDLPGEPKAWASLAWSIYTSALEVRSAVEANDSYALVKALGLFAVDLFGEFHPFGAPAFIAVKLLFAYYEATKPKNLSGYLLQRAVPELADVTNCNLFNERREQFRIDMTTRPWTSKNLTAYARLGMGTDGFAWHQGQLVYVTGSTIRPVLVATEKDANEFRALLQHLEYVQSGKRA